MRLPGFVLSAREVNSGRIRLRRISTNSHIARATEDNIDINAGVIVDGEETIQDVGGRIFEMIRRVASGERTKSEVLGHKEFVPWRNGPVM